MMQAISFSELRGTIESLDFTALVSIASTPKGFLEMLQRQPEFRVLAVEAIEDLELRSAVMARVDALAHQSVDERYVSPWDTALASYLYVLSGADPTTASLAADLVDGAPNVYWARHAAQLVSQPHRHGAESQSVYAQLEDAEATESSSAQAKEARFKARLLRVRGLSGRVDYAGSQSAASDLVALWTGRVSVGNDVAVSDIRVAQ